MTAGRAADREGNSSSSQHCPPAVGEVQILVDPNFRDITVVTSQQRTVSSNQTDETSGGVTTIGNSAANEDEIQVEETESDDR